MASFYVFIIQWRIIYARGKNIRGNKIAVVMKEAGEEGRDVYLSGDAQPYEVIMFYSSRSKANFKG